MHVLALRSPTSRITVGSSQIVYNVLRVGETDVDVLRPGTNLQRFRIPVADLTFVDEPTETSRPVKPVKPAINMEEIRERIDTAQQSSIDQFSGDIAVLKKYLKSKSVPTETAEVLDHLCKDTEESWRAAVAKIEELLEE